MSRQHLTMLTARTLPKVQDFDIVSVHPVFIATRRPGAARVMVPKAVAIPVPPPPPVAPSVGLVAVALGPERRVAVIRNTGGKSSIVHEGQMIDGWRVSEIAADHLMLTNEARVIALRFGKGDARPNVPRPSTIMITEQAWLRRR
jgi:hypothetical protein